jgi:hypothetical protein
LFGGFDVAQYQHLPIYKTTYELLQQVTKVVKSYPRDFKHTLGAKLREEVVDLVLFIYKANTFIGERAKYVAQV